MPDPAERPDRQRRAHSPYEGPASDVPSEPGEWTQAAPVNRPTVRSSSSKRPAGNERGLPGWAAVLLLIVIAGIGGVIDQVTGSSLKGVFNYGLIVASLVAILAVRRGQMFGVVISPPLVYFVGSAAKLYISSHGLKDHSKLTDAAANWLVYGFPAIAAATAVVLVIAGIRTISRR
ncbi:MAG: putative rane protein [Frankiales bacterium]|nr:putative rane protein [Frankiales bacterium]